MRHVHSHNCSHGRAEKALIKERLISMLRLAHAVEIGAYEAYEGHWRATKPLDNPVRGQIKFIQVDERVHRELVEMMLAELGAEPSKFLNFVFKIVGRIISYLCYVSPSKASALGAQIAEVYGVATYRTIAEVALEYGDHRMTACLTEMQKTEEEHEAFFKTLRSKK